MRAVKLSHTESLNLSELKVNSKLLVSKGGKIWKLWQERLGYIAKQSPQSFTTDSKCNKNSCK